MVNGQLPSLQAGLKGFPEQPRETNVPFQERQGYYVHVLVCDFFSTVQKARMASNPWEDNEWSPEWLEDDPEAYAYANQDAAWMVESEQEQRSVFLCFC